MPFDLPDLAWQTWLYIAAGGALVALYCGYLSKLKRGAGFFAFVITLVSAFCAAVGLIKWLRP